MIDKTKIAHLTILILVLMSGSLAIAAASEIQFDVADASFTVGSGYGIDADERAGTATLLDVWFDTSGFTPQNFVLNSIVDSQTFDIGTVGLQELNAHGGIQLEETDLLDVKANLEFFNPLETTREIIATGTVTTGSLSDSHLDYTLIWNPIDVNLADGRSFQISLSAIYFHDNKVAQTQTATITLQPPHENMRLMSEAVPVVAPEPASLLLLGTGLGALGLAANCRKIK